MKRSVLALGASVIALALMAGPAAAEPGWANRGRFHGALRVGAVAADVPVRIASDGRQRHDRRERRGRADDRGLDRRGPGDRGARRRPGAGAERRQRC